MEHRAAPPSPRAPCQRRFHPPAEMAQAPTAHRGEAQREIFAGISRASRDTRKWRRKADTDAQECRPARFRAEAQGATSDAAPPARAEVRPTAIWPEKSRRST